MDRWTLALSSLAFVACTEARQEEDNSPITTASATSGNATAADTSTGEPDSDDDIKLDLGDDTDDPDTGIDPDGDDESGCDKVDFLFVIDNSGSMGEFQDNLVANFPGFIETIQNELDEAQDYHIMVVDTDPAPPVNCPVLCEQAMTDGCLDEGEESEQEQEEQPQDDGEQEEEQPEEGEPQPAEPKPVDRMDMERALQKLDEQDPFTLDKPAGGYVQPEKDW